MNQENKKQIIMAGILGIVLVIVLVYQFAIAGGTGTPPQASNSGGTQTASNAEVTRPTVAPTRLKKVDVDLDELREKVDVVTFRYENNRISRSPMTPLVGRIRTQLEGLTPIGPASTMEIAEKSVTGIVYNEYAPVAVIDDEVVSEGHQYADGVVLTKIEPKRVWFKWGDAEIPVELKEL